MITAARTSNQLVALPDDIVATATRPRSTLRNVVTIAAPSMASDGRRTGVRSTIAIASMMATAPTATAAKLPAVAANQPRGPIGDASSSSARYTSTASATSTLKYARLNSALVTD